MPFRRSGLKARKQESENARMLESKTREDKTYCWEDEHTFCRNERDKALRSSKILRFT